VRAVRLYGVLGNKDRTLALLRFPETYGAASDHGSHGGNFSEQARCPLFIRLMVRVAARAQLISPRLYSHHLPIGTDKYSPNPEGHWSPVTGHHSESFFLRSQSYSVTLDQADLHSTTKLLHPTPVSTPRLTSLAAIGPTLFPKLPRGILGIFDLLAYSKLVRITTDDGRIYRITGWLNGSRVSLHRTGRSPPFPILTSHPLTELDPGR